MSWGLVSGVLGFAVVGFDPFSVLILAAALGAGARRRALVAFAVGTLLATVVLGTVLGRSVHHLTGYLLHEVRHVPGGWRLAVELVVAAALAGWAAHRWASRDRPRDPTSPPKGLSARALLVAGVLWGLAGVSDPGYVGAVLLTAREDSHLVMAGALLLWFLVAQSPMVVTVAALAAGRDSPAVTRVVAGTQRLVGALRPVATAVVALAALALLADGVTYVVSGRFALPPH
ncbi:hypothetical protein [Lapillicoccus jejuensis]|uniref:Sap-like sulfolipid-1-addressing protein n=1 Tax=Lapillicoccus jejuensis TaxID=402171 RepID=A0A542DYU0_9MICO|nr:hypothetical protein [Lapillicoccus jejuensis]TQJ08248.1 hypothetical protein FB458_1332 [Lapillicoccus jejuensis]